MQDGAAIKPLAYPIKDAQRILGLSKTTIYDLAASGKLKLCKIGRKTLLTDDECRRLLREGRKAA
jgi:excisionase family DNA binding protein